MTAEPKPVIPVVFLSGMLADQRMWQPVLDRLAARKESMPCPAIMPIIPPLDTQDDVQAMARSVLDQAPDRFALVGMSMGGYVAFEILRMARRRVSHLMLVNTRATKDDPAMRRRRLLLARLSGRNLPFQGVNDAMLDDMLHPNHRHDAELIGLLSDMAEDFGVDVFRRQITAVANRPDSMALLSELDMPCTVMVGEADRVISPTSHHEMAARIAGATMIDVAGAGHYVPLEQPDIFADALCALVT
ncbi:alpha/beta fold hydrolase [Thalassospira xiamenensis]|uniref:Alpha/beta hydrolase n=1 Tax=Thalassospira xiamenensis TaxID=220697 RepID=A0A367WUU4_9PROT|nr:alpha/beta hydrolase [Thalassospira xiamenensis]KZB57745.1 alpha/beta hydrolase [Thalassospira xiamenensis]RCK45234.1 alpha/beta hydrolase [Thalassospira xiamenensis]